MKLQQIKANMTTITTPKATVLFSYNTPVAALTDDGFIRTAKHYSVTTSRHINQWLDGRKATTVDQSVIDALLG